MCAFFLFNKTLIYIYTYLSQQINDEKKKEKVFILYTFIFEYYTVKIPDQIFNVSNCGFYIDVALSMRCVYIKQFAHLSEVV